MGHRKRNETWLISRNFSTGRYDPHVAALAVLQDIRELLQQRLPRKAPSKRRRKS